MSDPAPVAFLLNFAPDGLEFSLNFWVADPDKGKDNVRSAINIAILEGLREAGIDIPYPQRVLRIDSLPPGVGRRPSRLAYNRKKARPFFFFAPRRATD